MVGGRGLGPLTRCLAVADEARRRGHQSHFLIKETFVPLVEQFRYPWTLAAEPQRRSDFRQCPDIWSEIATYLGLTEPGYLCDALRIEKALVENFKPDWVFIESNITLPLTCLQAKIPFVSTLSWADMPGLRLRTQKINLGTVVTTTAQHNIRLEKLGLSTIADLSELVTRFADLIVIPSIPILQPELSRDSRLTFVGHLLFEQLEYAPLASEIVSEFDGELRVYAYLATSDIHESVWVNALENVCRTDGIKVLATTKEKYSPRGRNCITRQWLAGGSAMSLAHISLHAGTANTIALAAKHGVPQVMLPCGDSERRYNSEQVERCDAGLLIEMDDLDNAERLCHSLLRVVKEEARVRASRRLQEEMQLYRGPERVLDLIDK